MYLENNISGSGFPHITKQILSKSQLGSEGQSKLWVQWPQGSLEGEVEGLLGRKISLASALPSSQGKALENLKLSELK